MATSKSSLSWVPISSGGIYCSPACGRGCTWAQFQTAKRQGARLAKLSGKGFESRVWENLGWWYEAQKRISPHCRIIVRKHDFVRGYSAELHLSRGLHQQWFAKECSTPSKAVQTVLAEAKKDTLALVKTLREIIDL